MGQKINPTILRIGNTKQWESKYLEKKSSEAAIYTFRDLETQKFIKKLLNDNNLILYNCQTRYFENSLHIYLSYHVATEPSTLIKDRLKEKQIKPKFKKKFLTKGFRRKYFNLKQKTRNYFKYTKTIQQLSNRNLAQKYNKKNMPKEIKNLIKKNNYLLKHKRNKFISYYKLASTAKHHHIKTLKNIQTSAFWNKIAESIHLFLGNSVNIFLHFKQITKTTILQFTNKQLKMLKKVVGQLRKYKQSKFFKQGINLIFTFSTTNQSANLLATFIATELKKQKRHNFFLSFIKTAIKLLNQKNISIIKGVKIKIKGRFNGAPRAKHKIITIGKGVPVLSIKSNINYSEATSFTANGTFGVKVWAFY